MEDVLSTAVESLPVDQIDPIDPQDLSAANLKAFLQELLPGIRSLAFNIVVCVLI